MYLSDNCDYFIFSARGLRRNDISVNLLAVQGDLDCTALKMIRILNPDVVGSAAEDAPYVETVPLGRDAGAEL